MAKERIVNTRFWSDNFISDLNPLDRYLFLYFLTNEHTNISGIYEVPIKRISDETGIEKEMVAKMLKRLKGKVEYVDGWVILINFTKHQRVASESVREGIKKALKIVPKAILDQAYRAGYTDDGGMMGGSSHILELESESKPEPISEPKSEPVNEEPKRKKITYSEAFEQFWRLYPTHNGKIAAFNEWKKLTDDEHAAIMADIPKRKQDKKRRAGFVKDPERYLKKRQWEDEIQAAQTVTTNVLHL